MVDGTQITNSIISRERRRVTSTYNAEACKTCLQNAHFELKQHCTAAHTTGTFYGSNCNMEYWPIHDI
ncbi:unnamed protein product [Linum trigynum]|uniref:Gnk2-homologous domain-containing protein n=1 Tax=Linum trigynum TaxID=586398 RepID=A0AAV2GU82_9ROSI